MAESKASEKASEKAATEQPAPKSVYDVFGTNETEETSGIWIDYGPFKFRIARAGGANKKFASAVETRMRPYRAAINSGAMDEDVARKLLAEAYAEAIVLDWDGVTDRSGNKLVCNKKNVEALLIDLPELFAALRNEAESVANFLQAGASADAKS